MPERARQGSCRDTIGKMWEVMPFGLHLSTKTYLLHVTV